MFSLLVVPGTALVKVGENVKSIDIPMTMKLAQDGGGEVVNYYSLRILSIATLFSIKNVLNERERTVSQHQVFRKRFFNSSDRAEIISWSFKSPCALALPFALPTVKLERLYLKKLILQ